MKFFSSPAMFPPPRTGESGRWRGLRVGLLGGSFNPPHRGHVHISLEAIKALGLDSVWWLVSPQNPLKSANQYASYEHRLTLCKALAAHPRIIVSDLEKQAGVTHTYSSVRLIKKHFPATEFVWLTGMDNALSIHRWYKWRSLYSEIAMCHLARPPALSLVRNCPARMLSQLRHVYGTGHGRPDLTPGTVYWLVHKRMINVSSTMLRASN